MLSRRSCAKKLEKQVSRFFHHTSGIIARLVQMRFLKDKRYPWHQKGRGKKITLDFLKNHPWFLANPLQNWGFKRLQKSTLIFRPSCFCWRCSDTADKKTSYISMSEPFPAPFDATACWTSIFTSAWHSSSVRRSITASLKLVSKKRPLVAM